MTESFRLGLNTINHTFYSPLALLPPSQEEVKILSTDICLGVLQ
jgi:hypothetical protein